MSEWKNWGKAMFIAVGVTITVRTFLFAPYIVEGSSMEPTLHNQEKIFVEKMSGWKDHFSRGEIVIIDGKEEYYVKRIIGLPGDTILMKNDQLYINGFLTKEPYLTENRKLALQIVNRLTGDFGPISVPENQFFVMGDNRLYSMDSRNGLGFINKKDIVGQSKYVFFPLKNFRDIK